MSEIQLTGYEVIKQNLINRGFECENDNFVKTHTQVQQIIINGQPMSNNQEIKQHIDYLGDGSMDDEVLYGFKIYYDDNSGGDVWVRDWEDFISMIKI